MLLKRLSLILTQTRFSVSHLSLRRVSLIFFQKHHSLNKCLCQTRFTHSLLFLHSWNTILNKYANWKTRFRVKNGIRKRDSELVTEVRKLKLLNRGLGRFRVFDYDFVDFWLNWKRELCWCLESIEELTCWWKKLGLNAVFF